MGLITVKLKDDYDDDRNTRNYDKDEVIKVDENEFSEFYHIWIGSKLDLIPKKNCSFLGRLI